MAKEGLHDRGQFFQPPKLTDHQRLQLVQTEYLFSADPMIFDIVLYLLNGIKLWRIGWQRIDLQLAIEAIDALFYLFRFVCRMTIPDQKNRLCSIMHQSFEKFTYLVSGDGFFKDHKSHFASRTDCAHHIQAESGTCYFNNRGIANWGPGGAGMEIRTNPTFIVKIDGCVMYLCFLLYCWIYRLLPFVHRFRAFLVSAKKWLLATQPQLPEQAPNRGLAELDTEFGFDRHDNHRSSPEGKGKFYLERVAIYNSLINPGNLRPASFRGRAVRLPKFQVRSTPHFDIVQASYRCTHVQTRGFE